MHANKRRVIQTFTLPLICLKNFRSSCIMDRGSTSVGIWCCLCDKTQGLPELDVRIKWPNDLYLKGLKVGGILCTSSYEAKVYNICTGKHAFPTLLILEACKIFSHKCGIHLILSGIGLNVDNEKPSTCLNAALQQANAISPRLKREDVLAYFFNKFENLFEIFSNQGIFSPFCSLWPCAH